jgi:hypothetical protein
VVNARQPHAGRVLNAVLSRPRLNALVKIEQQNANAIVADHALQKNEAILVPRVPGLT